MNLLPWRKRSLEVAERDDPAISLADWASMFSWNGVTYSYPQNGTEPIDQGYASLAQGAYKSDAVVFACMLTRQQVFKEARFMFRRLRNRRPQDLFGTAALKRLETPWPGGTTRDLLAQMITHADLGGNAFVVDLGSKLAVLRPDWTNLIIGSHYPDPSAWDVDAEVVGYQYQEGGPSGGRKPVYFLPEQVAHFKPIPDPLARFRGMSWLTPVIREICADKAMTDHKITYLDQGATPNGVLKFDVDDLAQWQNFIKSFKADHEGAANKYKTLFLASGMDYTVVGSDMQKLDFKQVQGGGETRIAAAARTPPVLVGLSEGLAGSSLNAGNYQAAKRQFADGCLRDLWGDVSSSLSVLINVPGDAELWYDHRDIAYLQENQEDAAQIRQADAITIKALVDAGFESGSVVQAIMADDFSLLQHTGLFSVQLQPAGTVGEGKGALDQGVVVPDNKQQPPKRDGWDALEDELHRMVREARDPQPINVNVTTPDVHVDVQQPALTVEAPNITVEPSRIEEGAVQVHVAAPEQQPVYVNVEPAQVTVEPPRFDEGAISVHVDAAPTPDVNVHVDAPQVTVEAARAPEVTVEAPQVTVESPDIHIQMPDRPAKRTIEFSDGRTASIEETDA